jgi:hypothetical protein
MHACVAGSLLTCADTCAQELLRQMSIPPSYPQGLAHRAVYCSRTLNLRSIQVAYSTTLFSFI